MKTFKDLAGLIATTAAISLLSACTGVISGPAIEVDDETAPTGTSKNNPGSGSGKSGSQPNSTTAPSTTDPGTSTSPGTTVDNSNENPSTNPTPQGESAFARLVSREAFEQMFPERDQFYTYDGLVEATHSYQAFANTGDLDTQKREAAAFLANVGHETGGLVYKEEIARGEYCDRSSSYGCADGKSYYGRGPIQLSWNYNYGLAGNALGLPLHANPELVAEDPKVAWQTGLWFWMTQTAAGSMTSHSAITNANSFGETIRTINGARECNGGNPEQVQSRQDSFRAFCAILGVDPGENLGC